jgi:hypothetical protein
MLKRLLARTKTLRVQKRREEGDTCNETARRATGPQERGGRSCMQPKRLGGRAIRTGRRSRLRLRGDYCISTPKDEPARADHQQNNSYRDRSQERTKCHTSYD